MAVFGLGPGSGFEELHGRGHREAVMMLSKVVDSGYYALVSGLGSVGKSSVVKVFLNVFGHDYIYFRLPSLAGRRYVSARDISLSSYRVDGCSLTKEARRSLYILKHLRTGFVRRMTRSDPLHNFRKHFPALLRELGKGCWRFVIVFDHAHTLLFAEGAHLSDLVQQVWNSCSNASVILVTSAPGGLIKSLTRSKHGAEGLARRIKDVRVPRWGDAEAFEYLTRALEFGGISYDDHELTSLQEELSGVPGFITSYLRWRHSGINHYGAMHVVTLWAFMKRNEDLQTFLRLHRSPIYKHALAIIAEKPGGVPEDELVEGLSDRLRNRVRSERLEAREVLADLERAGIIENIGGAYAVTEAPMRRTLMMVAEYLRN